MYIHIYNWSTHVIYTVMSMFTYIYLIYIYVYI